MRTIALICLLLLVSGCSGGHVTINPVEVTATLTRMPTITSQPTHTVTVTPTLTMTPVPSSTPTRTPLPPEEITNVNNVYRMMVLIQLNAEMLQQTAERVRDKELSGINQAVITIALINLIDKADTAIDTITPPDFLEDYWDHAVYVHENTKSLISRWTGGVIKSPQVATEIATSVNRMENWMTETEVMLSEQYDFDTALLSAQRQEILDTVYEIFPTPTLEK